MLKKAARMLLAGAVLGTMVLPGLAQPRMAPKMSHGTTMSNDKMMKWHMMSMMSASEKRTFMRMSAAEKSLMMKMMRGHGTMHKMSGGKMTGGKKMVMMCSHCNVAMKNGKCPMCGMTAEQMKKM